MASLSTCIVLIEDSNHTLLGLRECGKAVEYVSATPPEVPHSGWQHCDRTTNHHAVPKGWT